MFVLATEKEGQKWVGTICFDTNLGKIGNAWFLFTKLNEIKKL